MSDQPELAPKRLRWHGHTDCGKVRKNNEDAFLALQFNAQELHHLGKIGDGFTGNSDFVFAVSDGIGGARAGEFVSRITVDKIAHLLPRSFKQSAVGLEAGYDDVLTELFDEIHKALTYLGTSDEECFGMGATLSLCWFAPGRMHFAHIGDSRIYYLPASGTGMIQVSHDDTHVGWLLRNKKINEREARHHPSRNALQRALGAGHQFVYPQLGAVTYETGDLFLLCTDGIVDGLFDEQLRDYLRSAPSRAESTNSAEQLVAAAVERSGRDNTTAVVVEVV